MAPTLIGQGHFFWPLIPPDGYLDGLLTSSPPPLAEGRLFLFSARFTPAGLFRKVKRHLTGAKNQT